MKTAVFASLIAGAAAFAPAKTVQSSTALTAAFGEEVRACVRVCVRSCVRVRVRWTVVRNQLPWRLDIII